VRSLYSSPLVHNSLHLLQKNSLHSSAFLYTHIHTYNLALCRSITHKCCTVAPRGKEYVLRTVITITKLKPTNNSQDPSFHPSDEHLEHKLLNTYCSEKYECTVIPKDAMESYRERGSIAPSIFHLSTICRLNGQSHIQVFTSGEKEPWDPLNKRLVGP